MALCLPFKKQAPVVFFCFLQNSQENACVRVSFLIKFQASALESLPVVITIKVVITVFVTTD